MNKMNQQHTLLLTELRGAAELKRVSGFTLLSLLVCGVLYTGLSTLSGSLLFPEQAKGSLIVHDGEVRGSVLIAQAFESERYVYGRPSAVDYDPTDTGGSNLAPSNPELRSLATGFSQRIQQREQVTAQQISVELISMSGSGLDPHISPGAASMQAARVAAARGVDESAIVAVINELSERPSFGIWGQARVNVLALNIALDDRFPVLSTQETL